MRATLAVAATLRHLALYALTRLRVSGYGSGVAALSNWRVLLSSDDSEAQMSPMSRLQSRINKRLSLIINHHLILMRALHTLSDTLPAPGHNIP